MPRLFGLGSNPQTFAFKCPDCGQIHRGSPSFALRRPEAVFDVPEAERASRIKADDDLCIIHPASGDEGGEASYWIRTVLEIPIDGAAEPFTWGLWVTQSKASFDRYMESYGQDQRDDGSFGWLPFPYKHYRHADDSWPTLGCDVRWQNAGQRPKLYLHECDEQLYRDQQHGISWDQAIAIAAPLMHGG